MNSIIAASVAYHYSWSVRDPLYPGAFEYKFYLKTIMPLLLAPQIGSLTMLHVAGDMFLSVDDFYPICFDLGVIFFMASHLFVLGLHPALTLPIIFGLYYYIHKYENYESPNEVLIKIYAAILALTAWSTWTFGYFLFVLADITLALNLKLRQPIFSTLTIFLYWCSLWYIYSE